MTKPLMSAYNICTQLRSIQRHDCFCSESCGFCNDKFMH